VNADTVFTLIASGVLYVELSAKPLAEAERVRVFSSEAMANAVVHVSEGPRHGVGSGQARLRPGNKVTWHGQAFTIVNVADMVVTLIPENGDPIEFSLEAFRTLVAQRSIQPVELPPIADGVEEALDILKHASKRDLEVATERHLAISSTDGTRHLASESDTPPRTIRSWCRKWKDAEAQFGIGFLGLLPNISDRGNRNRRLTDATVALIDEVIETQHESNTAKSVAASYRDLVRLGAARGVYVPSCKTYAKAVKGRPHYSQVKSRLGRKAAYPFAVPYLELSMTTPRHGDWPWHIAHIDHTELDIELVDGNGINLGRPWATFMMDAYSRKLLSFYLTFDGPSNRSCMMLIRDCVARHSRMPSILVVDNAKEFHSVHFTSLAAYCGTHIKWRPPTKGRYGPVIERLFGTTNRELIHTLTGNTKIMTNVRQVTKGLLAEWAYEWYDTAPHSGLEGQSPRDVYARGVRWTGAREQLYIPDDPAFRFVTLPSTRKGTATVTSQGVKVNHIYYWNDEFRMMAQGNRAVEIRVDPFDAAVVHGRVDGRFIECRALTHYAVLKDRSAKEMRLWTEEYRRRQQLAGRPDVPSAKRLAELISSGEANAAIVQQRRRDLEQRRKLRIVEDVAADPASLMPLPVGSRGAALHAVSGAAPDEDVHDSESETLIEMPLY
jgi:putative transposase